MSCKRSSSKRKKIATPVVVVEERNRNLQQLKRERPRNPITLSKMTRSVRAVLYRNQDMMIDIIWHTGKEVTFEKNTRHRLNKHKKAFRQFIMHQQW
eukprot:2412575-Ditylum_brightwellii.AAC.1